MVNFDDVDFPEKAFERIPEGSYIAEIIDQVEGTDKNDNGYLELLFEIADGDYKNRRLYKKFYIRHKNEKSRNGSLFFLKRLLDIFGPNIKTSQQLEGQMVGIKVIHNGTYDNVEGFFAAPNPAAPRTVETTEAPF